MHENSHEIRRENFIARFPLTAYFILSYLGSWLVWGTFVLSKDGTGILSFQSPMPFFLTMIISIFSGPFLAAFILIAITEGKAGLSHFLRRFLLWRVGFQWYLAALILIPLTMTLGSLILPNVWASFTPVDPLETLLSYVIFFIYPTLFGGPLGEEPGWRGFALPRLQKRYGPLIGSLVLGILWAFWHLPIWFSGQWTEPSAFNIIFFVAWITSISLIMTWIFNHTKGSILLAILSHASLDAFPNAVLWIAFPALTALTNFSLLYGYLGLTIGFGTLALLLITGTRGRLGYRNEREGERILINYR